jgi:type II secretory pathway pseudopilin PulG
MPAYLTIVLAALCSVALSFVASIIVEKTNGHEKQAMREVEKPKSGFSGLELGTVSVIVLVIAGIAVPNFFKAREAANEASAVSVLRNLNVALMQYHEKNGTLPQSLDKLGPSGAGLIDGQVAAGLKNGYRFIYRPPEDWSSDPKNLNDYSITAEPARGAVEKHPIFRTSQDGLIEAKLPGRKEFRQWTE